MVYDHGQSEGSQGPPLRRRTGGGMNAARLRVDQQIIAGLLKDRHALLERMNEITSTYDWAERNRASIVKELRIIDKTLEEIQGYYTITITGPTPNRKE